MITQADLSPGQRAEALGRLANEEFDVLVLGAGVVGAGAALDAATRGLSVALVEARDYASGTSSRSSKLIQGGSATWSSWSSAWCARPSGSGP